MKKLIFLFLLLMLAIPVSWASAAEFTADMQQTVDGKPIASGTVAVKGQKMRMDMKIDGQAQVTIVDPVEKKILLIMPSMHSYMEMPWAASKVNPSIWARDDPSLGTWRNVGEETLDGWVCEKRILDPKDPSQGQVTAWFATKLGYPIKIVHKGQGVAITTYHNIKIGHVPDGQFAAPAGYQAMTMPGMGGTRF